MRTHTPLFRSILDSTIWQESIDTKILWITMLAMADRDGAVHASIPGLAARAKIGIEECEASIQRLMSPDPYSRTKDNDGRRIAEIDGGWRLLNHSKYRDLAAKEDARAKNAERQRRFQERRKANG